MSVTWLQKINIYNEIHEDQPKRRKVDQKIANAIMQKTAEKRILMLSDQCKHKIFETER